MSEKQITRRFSLEEDFMNFNSDDLLYGFLRTLSTAEPLYKDGKLTGKYEEYLTKKEYMKNKKLIAQVCGYSTRTLERHLNSLFEAGLLDEGVKVVDTDNKSYDYECFWFPYDENGRYKVLERDMLRYLIDTRNAQVIRVYLWLLNKYEWKPDYSFSLVEIQKALGYSEKTKSATETIKNIVESLAREGIIRYENEYEYIECDGEFHKVPRKILKFVAKSVNQLRQVG